MRSVFQGMIRLYQLTLSPILSALGGGCRFYPSCSEYSKEAFGRYSWPRAVVMTTKRLLRCHPFHPGGIDPVR